MIQQETGDWFIPEEIINELIEISRDGAPKHGANSWLNKDNPSLQRKANYSSIFHHIIDALMGVTEDHESGRDPRMHAAWRLMADYYRDTKEDYTQQSEV